MNKKKVVLSNPKVYYTINSNYVLRRIADEILLIPVGSETNVKSGFITMNETAALIWDMISEGKSKDEIKYVLYNTYQYNQEEINKDVDEFIMNCINQKFIYEKKEEF